MPVTRLQDFSGFIDPVRSGPIFERAQRASVVQQLCRQVPLGLTATAIPVVTGRPTARWVAEGAKKPTTTGAVALKTMTPHKLATIFVTSAEVARANPANFVGLIRDSMAEAFAVAFDQGALHNAGPDGTPGGGPFDSYLDQTDKNVTFGTAAAAAGSAYGDLVQALSTVITDTDDSGRHYRVTGWALDDLAEPVLLSSTDANGRPIFVETPPTESVNVRAGRLIGRPTFMGEGVGADDTIGYGGDFSQAVWGAIGGINYDVSVQAAVTIDGALVSTWENNLVAVRAEAEYGFLVNDPNAFVRLTGEGGGGGSV
jgi:HK97 family phage major capsid protein